MCYCYFFVVFVLLVFIVVFVCVGFVDVFFVGKLQVFSCKGDVKVVGVYVFNWEFLVLLDCFKFGSIMYLFYVFVCICGLG